MGSSRIACCSFAALSPLAAAAAGSICGLSGAREIAVASLLRRVELRMWCRATFAAIPKIQALTVDFPSNREADL